MPLPRSIPTGQIQFTAQRYSLLLEQRGHRVPPLLKKIATRANDQADVLLEQIQQLERAGQTSQADYLTIRTAARLRVLRGSGQTETKTAYSEIEANRQRLKRAQQKAQLVQHQEHAEQDWVNGGRFAVYTTVMSELPKEQVILADQLLMDLMNEQPYLKAAQYQHMLNLALKLKNT